jgi:hypothetical protein
MASKKPDPMTKVLAAFRDPEKTDFADAWVGMEPTFQTGKCIRRWHKLSAKQGGEDLYFADPYILGTQEKVARGIKKKYEAKCRKGGRPSCIFDRVRLFADQDQWDVRRQNLNFYWADKKLEPFEVRFTLDPETFEYSIKPVPLVWFYDERFVAFLEGFLWKVPGDEGLRPSIAHGGGQFSLSAKTFLVGSLLADDIAYKLNHPELATWIMDFPNCDDRSFRATRERFAAFRKVLQHYWAGGFHPKAIGTLTLENTYLDRGFGPAHSPPKGLMDSRRGPVGGARQVFQTNFAFGRAVRLQAQNVHPGYWQSAHPDEDGYRPDQIMRYSEGNLNRLQIVGELHVKSGKVLEPERVPELNAPLDLAHLTEECSWENRAQLGRTSARDFVEALLLDVHHARYLQAHPHVQVKSSLLQDQLLGEGEETVKRHGGPKMLARLHKKARELNLEDSRNRIKSDFIEPETLFWAAWKVLPGREKAAIAREVISGFVERVEQAAAMDPRPVFRNDPMEWHRHRILPVLWEALKHKPARMKSSDPVGRELKAWQLNRDRYLARRPVYSQAGLTPPWEVTNDE